MELLRIAGAWPQKKLGLSGWKTIHAAIWAAIPLAFMHAYLVVQKFEGVIHYPSLVILGGLFLFAVWKLVFLPHPDRKQDVLMLATGSILACLIFFTLP